MLEHSDSVETSFVIMATSSGGFHSGAWDKQVWGNVFPIYETNGKYVRDLPENNIKEFRVICGAIIIYKETSNSYIISFQAKIGMEASVYSIWYKTRKSLHYFGIF